MNLRTLVENNKHKIKRLNKKTERCVKNEKVVPQWSDKSIYAQVTC